jgi:hypothetical protein
VNRHRPRRRRKEAATIRYLRRWRQQVEYAERIHRTSGYVYTGCTCCDYAIRDYSRDRLETLIHRGGRRNHRLRVEVNRLDERFRAVTVERGAWASAPWWRRREPWD